jgi:hypothetical protein
MRKYQIFVSTPEGDFFRHLYAQVIKPLQSEKIEVVCYFDSPQPGDFSKRISVSIGYSNLVIGVLSGANPNVLYELGIALGFGKPIIPLADSVDSLPAMLRRLECVRYLPGTLEDEERLLLDQLHRRIDILLHGQYVPLRRRTHAELLVRSHLGATSKSNSERPNADVLESAIEAYDAKNYGAVVEFLEGQVAGDVTGQLANIDSAYFYLSDAYFLLSEGLPSGKAKQDYLDKMLAVCDKGHKLFPNHRDLLKNLGVAHGCLNNLRFSEEIFRSLISKDPLWDVPQYNIACIHGLRRELFPCLEALSVAIERDRSWRYLARVDHSFDSVWRDDLFQRLLFPMPAPEDV